MTPEEIADALARSAGGRYEAPRFVGAGGMAYVYSAHDRRLSRQVAIKVIRPELLPTLARERFMREIGTMAALTHPAIVPLFDSGDADGVPYYVMPWIEGESLQQRLERGGPLALDTAQRILDDVGAALQHAHAHGIVHRDVKPGNILLVGDRALLSDFGIARAAASAALVSLTTMGLIVGSPPYMSPEQAAGEHHLAPASDQYSLACVFFEMLTGRWPIKGDTPQQLLAGHVTRSPASLRESGVAAPDALESAIARALSKDAALRFPDVTAFVQAVHTALPTGEGRAPARPAAPPRLRFRAAAVAAGVLVVGGAVALRALPGRHGGATRSAVVQVAGFPLTSPGGGRSGEGDEVAVYLGSLMAQVEGLRWLDGWNALAAEERQQPEHLSDARRLAVARGLGAGRVVDGRVLRAGDSVRVVLRLLNAGDGTTIQSATGVVAAAVPAAALAASVRALNALLPALVGREGLEASAMTALADRDPAAVADWLAGERYFRRARYDSALAFLESAVAKDSGFAIAMLRAAEAAEAEEQYGKAARLARLAAARTGALAPAYADYARGLDAKLHGAYDSAQAALERSLVQDSTLARAWFVLGDLLSDGPQRSSANLRAAQAALTRVLALDPNHAPSLHHLAVLAILRRDLRGADSLLQALRVRSPSERQLASASLARDCLAGGPALPHWAAEAARSAHAVAMAGGIVARGALDLPCAAAAFRAVLASATIDSSALWTAALGLNGVLMAEGKTRDAIELISGERARLPAIVMLYCLDWYAGAPTADSCTRAAHGQPGLMERSPWMVSVWGEIEGKAERMDSAAAYLEEHGDHDEAPEITGVARGVRARAALVRGDSAVASRLLDGLQSTARSSQRAWGIGEPLAVEALLRCKLSGGAAKVDAGALPPIEISALPLFVRSANVLDPCRVAVFRKMEDQ